MDVCVDTVQFDLLQLTDFMSAPRLLLEHNRNWTSSKMWSSFRGSLRGSGSEEAVLDKSLYVYTRGHGATKLL